MDRLSQLLQYYEEDPDDPFVRFALAMEYLKRKRFEEARTFLEGLVVDHPRYVGTYYHLGKLYEREGEREKALETYRKGVAVAMELRDFHARAELQDALMQAQGVGLDED